MYFIYNIGLSLLNLLLSQVHKGRLLFVEKGSKTHRFIMGQKDLLPFVESSLRDETRHICWVHASSMGEYAVARPIIRQLQSRGMAVVLTFFSPSGYEALNGKRDTADYIFYLPLDTRKNVKRFLDIVKPSCTIFVISEYWINYLHELRRRQIPTYLLSVLVPDTSYLLRWYAWPIRRALNAFTLFIAHDEKTKKNLHRMGFDNCKLLGDPLFDNALNVAKSDYRNDIIEKFCKDNERIFVAGSINDENDRTIVYGLANAEPQMKFIMVPHEISDTSIDSIFSRCKGSVMRYSDCNENTDFSGVQILVIDYVGDLARIYRYGNYAYVGGGFTRYLHSVIEPVAYGLPVAFGPNIHRKSTPQQMIDLGIGAIVQKTEDLRHWIAMIDSDNYETIRQKACVYASKNGGSALSITNLILSCNTK